MTSPSQKVALAQLHERLHGLLPDTRLTPTVLPLVPEISLWLFDDLQPGQALDASVVNALMEEPPYWTLCWASGQVLARYILDNPELVAGRRMLDLGAGSGVVAIAAALAGARQVLACDTDIWARRATSLNAGLNGVRIDIVDDLAAAPGVDLITAADILYDRDNLPLVDELARRAAVLLADSRVPDLDPEGYRLTAVNQATTWPDLDESAQFNQVRLFAAPAPAGTGSQRTGQTTSP
jgi:predicted nicotinamide N-methyase